MFVIELKLQKHFSETFLNEEKQADIFQTERFHFCFADLKHFLFL